MITALLYDCNKHFNIKSYEIFIKSMAYLLSFGLVSYISNFMAIIKQEAISK